MKPGTKIVISSILIIIIIISSIFGVRILLKYFTTYSFDSEWAFEITRINELRELGFSGSNVTVGIVDTGIDINHPDLSSVTVTYWHDYINNQSMPYDDNGHGTHTAGIIAGKGRMNGVSPDVKLIVAKALRGDGTGDDDVVADAINFCVDPNNDGDFSDGSDVICLSLGGKKLPVLGTESEKACKNAVNRGVFVVAAAGNDYPNRDVSAPGTVEYVISVGAVDENKNIASFSSKGWNVFRDDPDKKPELVAPGVNILSTWKDGEYAYCSGTSQAAPFVAGTVALFLDAYPQYRHNSSAVHLFKNVFMDTAEKCGEQNTPHDDRYGYGLVQAYDAYVALK
jgi:serine protease AprX